MAEAVTDLASARLIRRAPDHALTLAADDQSYLLTCLGEIEAAFGVRAVPALPLDQLPGRTLMRQLIELRRTLRARDADQRRALGRLTSAILLVDTACAFDQDHAAAVAASTLRPAATPATSRR